MSPNRQRGLSSTNSGDVVSPSRTVTMLLFTAKNFVLGSSMSFLAGTLIGKAIGGQTSNRHVVGLMAAFCAGATVTGFIGSSSKN
ncbi:truncated pp38 similar to MDV pp38 [Meleagrid alphaherpesvirus 1]|uniref:MDV-1 LORF4 pp38-like protein n=2 Tax=Mardivirus TaxID=180252 RepID=Q77L65_MEHV1|nr:protein pp38 [Meleagrid alphaherpesvirus 1]AAA52275.1 pp38 homologue; ORF3 [Meleagrid alphaherpesvirus 1]AAG30101.1 MDV-1 LORF4 pp38-like protein [Meleagrid alphaherpesvirus 1]AAG45801.1 truncated pp38 similar to MDV pp38 [Meleagrid alphaherpesvirus 1]CAA86495.1 ORF3 [Gallid alphaherpesvirus 2]